MSQPSADSDQPGDPNQQPPYTGPNQQPPYTGPNEQPPYPGAFGGVPYYPGYYPGFAAPAADPRFVPGDPLVSADFAGWWRRAFAVTRRAWRQLALVQVITAIPALALLIPGQAYYDVGSRRLFDDLAAADDLAGLRGFLTVGLVFYATLFLASLIQAFGTLACVRLVADVALGRDARAGTALRRALPRLPALIGWTLLAALLAIAAVLACFLPVIYVAAVLVLLPAVVLFEPGGGGISRCFRLFHTDLGAAVARIATIAGLGLAVAVPAAVLGAVASTVTQGSAFPDPHAAANTAAIVAGSAVGTVLNSVATVISGVLLTPLIVATYADLRARREPFVTTYLAAE